MTVTNWRERELPAGPEQRRWLLSARSEWARQATALGAEWGVLAPLWVGGLLLLCLLAGHLLFTYGLALSWKTYDWAQYLILGTIFPALILLGVLLLPRQGRVISPAARAVQTVLVLLLLVGVGTLVITG